MVPRLQWSTMVYNHRLLIIIRDTAPLSGLWHQLQLNHSETSSTDPNSRLCLKSQRTHFSLCFLFLWPDEPPFEL